MNQVFCASRPEEYRKAGLTDLIRLEPAPGCNPLFLPKWKLEALVCAIVHHEFIHLSGPTGTAKSSLLEALYLKPVNFEAICSNLAFPVLPLRLFPIEMAAFDTPGELYQRTILKDGTTYDEKSRLVQALEEAAGFRGRSYPLIWLREMGRVSAPGIQGGLLDLMTKGDIPLDQERHLSGQGIAWVADSNYQAEEDFTHTLVTLDDALKRRFNVNLTLDYLSAEEEVQILESILNGGLS